MSSSSGRPWDSEKILQLYLHDYMVRRGMHETAAIFKKEAGVYQDSAVMDSPNGFLHEWWSIFNEVYSSKEQNNQKNGPESSNKVIAHLQEDIDKQPQKQVFRDSGGGIHLERDEPRDPQYIVERTIKPVNGPREKKTSDGLNLVPQDGSRPLDVADVV
ncbi:hypothetical protein L6164_032864 [Bauhinia variegata]|uniref:Uncharacterized protein n=1 Tax=Bauhinia variegata TaxID=167791 RepID=A0ACB9KQ50_BAUVA|nr:hypothetical protein L6164_032864 [Bauhinia variegata]